MATISKMTPNKHKVNAKAWRRWNNLQRAVFNGTYEDILQIGASLFVHPKTVARKLSKAEFGTIAWNAAWIAADQVREPGSRSEVHALPAKAA